MAPRRFALGAATCPLFRQHGARDTEIWLLGDESEAAVTKVINWRANMKDYVTKVTETVSQTGEPINRPLYV